MKLKGSYRINVNKGNVWQALNDPDILNKCIKGCESLEKENDTVHRNIHDSSGKTHTKKKFFDTL